MKLPILRSLYKLFTLVCFVLLVAIVCDLVGALSWDLYLEATYTAHICMMLAHWYCKHPFMLRLLGYGCIAFGTWLLRLCPCDCCRDDEQLF